MFDTPEVREAATALLASLAAFGKGSLEYKIAEERYLGIGNRIRKEAQTWR